MSRLISLLTVPGPVSDFTASPEVDSVVLTWSVPQEPNGIIIAYEVTYIIDGIAITVVNSTNGAPHSPSHHFLQTPTSLAFQSVPTPA